MSTLDEWTRALCAELGVEPPGKAMGVILATARDVAHAVDRPAAPVTAYLLGLAVGGGQPLAEAAGKAKSLAEGWPGTDAAD
jgi:hypothetical protein